MSEMKPVSVCRQARQVLGLTQVQLAERLGVSRPTITLWEGKPDRMPVWGAKVLKMHCDIQRLTERIKQCDRFVDRMMKAIG